MILFNLEKLVKLSKGNPTKILKNLQDYYIAKKKNYIPRYALRGESWILNPEPLFSRIDVDIGFRVQYILLAARRDRYLYNTYGTKTLLLSYFPDLDIDKIKYNPLLTITKSEIHFKYE